MASAANSKPSSKVAASTPKPKEIDGYLVFKNEIGKVLSVVHCFYKEEQKSEVDVLEDASAKMFVDPSAAAAAGATIFEVVSGPTYEKYKEQQKKEELSFFNN
mgnify:CR=1 FL=1